MAHLIVSCRVRQATQPEPSAHLPATSSEVSPSGHDHTDMDVAWPRPLPVAWSNVLSFSPDVFVFSSVSAVDSALGTPHAGILLSPWRHALFAAVGTHTARHLARALARIFGGRPPGVWTPTLLSEKRSVPPPSRLEGLEPLLQALPAEALRVVVFGAKGGKACRIATHKAPGATSVEGSASGRELLSVPCYELVPVEGLADALAVLIAQWQSEQSAFHGHKASERFPRMTVRVGSGALAAIVCDALEQTHLLGGSEGWLFFEARHESAQALLASRGLSHRVILQPR